MEKSTHGGKREGAGRPTITEEKRNRNIGIRVSESELKMLKEKSSKANMNLTEYILYLAKNN